MPKQMMLRASFLGLVLSATIALGMAAAFPAMAEQGTQNVMFSQVQQSKPVVNLIHLPRTQEALFMTITSNVSRFVEHTDVQVTAQNTKDGVVWQKNIALKDGVLAIPYGSDEDIARFVLNVQQFDKKGHRNVLAPVILEIINAETFIDLPPQQLAVTKQGIKTPSAALRVLGENAFPGTVAMVGAQSVQVDNAGRFSADIYMPKGRQEIEILYKDVSGKTRYVQKVAEVKNHDMFVIAMGDITYGENDFTGPSTLKATSQNEFGDEFTEGQLGLFAKGRLFHDINLTAMVDSGEGEFDDLFRRLDDKDTQSLLRRFEADKYYNEYGDDSETRELASTAGNVYLKLEKDKTSATWGTFDTQVNSNELGRYDRNVYGAQLKHESLAQTEHGDTATVAKAFYADPGTIQQIDEFRGTGGSVYFFNYQDLTVGSEQLFIEVRDRHTGIVKSVEKLAYAEDYDIDYLQGRVILHKTLASTSQDDTVIATSTSNFGDPVFLVAHYEVTPTNLSLNDNFVAGGEVQQWFGKYLRLGGTYVQETTNSTSDNKLYGGSVLLQPTDNFHISAEHVLSEGTQFAPVNQSLDGGFNNISNSLVTNTDESAATQVKATYDNKTGTQAHAYYRTREGGFTNNTIATASDSDQYGGHLQFAPTDATRLRYETDFTETMADNTARHNLEAAAQFGRTTATMAAEHNTSDVSGDQTLVGGKLDYRVTDKTNVYVVGQHTVDNSGNQDVNNQVGIGGTTQLTDRLSATGEVRLDDADDMGALIRMDYAQNPGTNYYLAYSMATEGSNGTNPFAENDGTLTVGGRSRVNEKLGIYAEEVLYHGQKDGLSNQFGLDYNWTENLTFGASAELGKVDDLDRKAIGVTASYGDDDDNVALALEYRNDQDDAKNTELETYVVKLSVEKQLNDAFKALMRTNMAFSEGNGQNVNDGDFVESTWGLAYRPIDNNKLVGLAYYRFYYDIPTTTQQLNSGTAALKQRNHIFAIDGDYRLWDTFSIGGKYGLKMGETNLGNNNRVRSTTHLGVIRGNYHLPKRWDALAEYRVLATPAVDAYREGALVGLYRHVGNHLKLGAGYNWADFDDDLANSDFNNEGWFINAVAKY